MRQSKLLLVAQVGRVVGVSGCLKLHIMSDFPYIFTAKASFHTKTNGTLSIHSFNPVRNLVVFEGYDSREEAAKLVNCELYSTFEESKIICKMQDGEFLWEDMIGISVFDKSGESNLELGKVINIERIGKVDYLIVRTDSALIKKGLSKQFLIPNIEHFVSSLSLDGIFTNNALDILIQS